MIDTRIDEALAQAVRDVLDTMFFADTLAPPDNEPFPNGAGISARLTFEGNPPGAFRLRVSLAAAQSMAADFTGIDPDSVTPEQIAEVVSETANMMCGSVLSRIESTAVFQLANPQIVDDEPDCSMAVGATSFTAWLGSGALEATLGLAGPKAQL